MNGFGAETNLDHEFRGFWIQLNNLESKLLIRGAEENQRQLELKILEERITKLEKNFKIAA